MGALVTILQRTWRPRVLLAASALALVAGALAWAQPGSPAAGIPESKVDSVAAAPGTRQTAPQQQGALGSPTQLVVAATASGQATLSWRPAPNADIHWAYSVNVNGSGGKWTTAPAGSSVTITDLINNQDYWFIVIANRGPEGNREWSQWSNWIKGTINAAAQPAPPPQPVAVKTIPAGAAFSSISAGGLHSCGVLLDGSIACWGSDGRGQATPPEGEFLSVSAGGGHTCGVKADGTIACWGSAAVPSPPAEHKFVSVDSGDVHSCGLIAWPGGQANHVVICWGAPGLGRTDDWGSNYSYKLELVTVGDDHNCVLYDRLQLSGYRNYGSGVTRCWGSNDSGQRWNIDGDVSVVTAGGEHTCVLYRNGRVGCRGNNTSGQNTPPAPPEGDFDQDPFTYTAVSAGGSHTCAINGDGNATQAKGTVRCWGDNTQGQATPPGGVFTAISAGRAHTYGLRTNGQVACWGDNTYSQAPR